MTQVPVFRRLGARVSQAPQLVGETENLNLVTDIVRYQNGYGLTPDPNASYNNPVTEEPARAKVTPEVKEMKGQLIESLSTLTLSPTAAKSPITRLPAMGPEPVTTSVSSPGREILQLTTKLSPLAERPEVVNAEPPKTVVATTLVRPESLNIDPTRIGYGKGSGKSGFYTVVQLKQILKSLEGAKVSSSSKRNLVDALVAYLRINEPELYSKLPDDVRK